MNQNNAAIMTGVTSGITTDPYTKKSIVSLHPIGGCGKPKEMADAIVWLCSDEASFITDHSMLTDDGYTSR